MAGFMSTVHAYQVLLTRAERLRIPLDAEERCRLSELEAALGAGEGEGTRRMPRILMPVRVMLTMPGRFASARLRDVSGGGMRVRTSCPPPEGTPVLVHVPGPVHGEEHVFPARVAWRTSGEGASLGLAFDGMPTHVRPCSEGGGGPRRRTPLVA